jgi:hypothetical protein
MPAQEGRCVSCGFLGKRPLPQAPGAPRYPGIFEVFFDERSSPPSRTAFSIIHPANVQIATEVVCYRGVADLPSEVATVRAPTGMEEAAALDRVLRNDRKCQQWSEHMRGLDPKEHLMERRLRDLEEDRKEFQIALSKGTNRLTWAAVILAGAQVLTMNEQSFLYRFGEAIYRIFTAGTRP